MRIIYLMIASIFLFGGCASRTTRKLEPAASALPKITTPHIDAQEIMIHPGHVKKVDFLWEESWGNIVLECNGNSVYLAREGNHLYGYLAEKYHSKLKPYSCLAKTADKDFLAFSITVEKYPFQYETLNVDKKRVNLNAKDLMRWRKEMAELKKVYAGLKVTKVLFKQSFVSPLNSKITSLYGKARLFNNNKNSWHNGVDFRAKTGTPIPVTNDGEVVFTGDLFFNGNTVIVDHGLGIISLYCHLSKIGVKRGDILKQGELVGLAGATGRVTGPHLHWGVRVNKDWINGLSLVEESQR